MGAHAEFFEWRNPFTTLGFLLVIIGVLLVALPYIVKHFPAVETFEKIPPILLYVYRKDDFYFLTSPILIIAGAAYLLWLFAKTSR